MPIRLFLSDVDGCLTDGGMYYSASGDELKKFCVYDGMGMVLLRQKGVRCGILTSETTPIVLQRARKLHLDYLYMGVGRQMDKTPVHRYVPATAERQEQPAQSKLEACQQICRELGITLQEVCYIGDDINDIDILKAVGLPACPANALPVVKAIPGIVQLSCKGGDGAVRELAEIILSRYS